MKKIKRNLRSKIDKNSSPPTLSSNEAKKKKSRRKKYIWAESDFEEKENKKDVNTSIEKPEMAKGDGDENSKSPEAAIQEEQDHKVSSTKCDEAHNFSRQSTPGRKRWILNHTETVKTPPKWLRSSRHSTPAQEDNATALNFDITAPSTSRQEDVAPPSERRRTYELDKSVTELEVLKTLSETADSPAKSGSRYFSNVTMRRRGKINDSPAPARSLRRSLSAPTPPVQSPAILKRTSTPLQARKSNNLLKNVLTRELDFSAISNVSSKKFQSKIKSAPNFAAIHQKALNKVEDIGAYRTRKAERAQCLLSGQKPPPPVGTPERKESKKVLRFEEGTEERSKEANFIPLPSTPKPKARTPSKGAQVGTPKVWSRRVVDASTSTAGSTVKTNLAVVRVNRIPVRIRQEKEKKPKAKIEPAVALKKQSDLRKHIATVKDRAEIIKGVRSNRRFDLLMQMRMKR